MLDGKFDQIGSGIQIKFLQHIVFMGLNRSRRNEKHGGDFFG